MKFKFDTQYSEQEMQFVERHQCEIISEMKMSKTNFRENEMPRRMLKYEGDYVAEIYDDEESNQLVWAVLRKRKGIYYFSGYYDSLDELEQGL